MLKKRVGFSLIELMVVLAIVAFLAIIAMPNFLKFLAKAKRAEAYMNLSSIYTAQKAYFLENNKYSNILTGQNGIGWKPEGETYYSYGFPGADNQNYFLGKLKAPASALEGAKADSNGFVVYAAADIDGDGEFDILSIDQNKNISIVKDDLA